MDEAPATILAIGLGALTGWAAYKHGVVTSGTAVFSNDRFCGGDMRHLRFVRWLSTQRSLPTILPPPAKWFVEEVRRHVGTTAAHIYGGLLGQLTACCEQWRIPYQGVPVQTIKRHVAGRGNASKAEVIEAVRKLGYAPADDNEADALALLNWALDQ